MLPTTISGSKSPVILFLHYFGGSRREWRAVVGKLESTYRCVIADAPGFGDAVDIPGYTVEEMTQHLFELIDSDISGPFVLVGHSMMGKVSMVAASRRPHNLIGMVLVAPSPLESEPMTEEARASMVGAQQSAETAREFFIKGAKHQLNAQDIKQGVEDAQRANPIAWRRWPESGSREDWAQAIPSIDLPTLLVVGEFDDAIPLEFQKKWTMPHLPNGKLEVILGVGHLLPYEAPAELGGLIDSFVRTLSM